MIDEWDLYFSTIVGWQLHPGYNRENAKKLTIKEAAELADHMIQERKKWY